MSTLDEKATEVMDDDSAHAKGANESGASGYIILFFIIGFAASMVLGWVAFPKLLYSQKQQPFSFNHAMHVAEVNNGCESCHFFRDDGSFSGIPKLAQCTGCHDETMGESEAEATFVEQYVWEEREVPWYSYSRQPDCVFFSHAAHVVGAKMDCVTCHGHIGESESSRPYEYNRITGYSRDIWGKNIAGLKKNSWDRMKMDDCAQCHKEAGIVHTSSVQTKRDACFVCHK
ncbi:menaquinone reductase multiheme cytochrome c subunit QrcA [Desulfosarcina ovata]|uniref:Menaquinone reductase, multiheme cytochrome c subunit n=2 Tax=Desulfosarcina ovata TaxID=83564 RepID=A0A5K8A8W7_9BACT|nr:menaquinone reductase multiheme cytochrome c subunit QrcA [Desulfosarcina ovata]BBO81881.1 menaquinone reductase, multiheme cytochrome c subunit [Desulfosarcina ovata subsp. sediminis]BBO89103.1 menaquinone reductase, multiheme cytochrome c subunit [Desulfosarcina ovata subsp. ovata]